MTQACFLITKFDKIRLFHNIISGSCPFADLHKNSFICIIMLSVDLYTGDSCVTPPNKKN
ncbi:MAG TPA: hypothetical protein VGH05_01540 [Buttiauxella sp.]